jgi:hypothetical protein
MRLINEFEIKAPALAMGRGLLILMREGHAMGNLCYVNMQSCIGWFVSDPASRPLANYLDFCCFIHSLKRGSSNHLGRVCRSLCALAPAAVPDYVGPTL